MDFHEIERKSKELEGKFKEGESPLFLDLGVVLALGDKITKRPDGVEKLKQSEVKATIKREIEQLIAGHNFDLPKHERSLRVVSVEHVELKGIKAIMSELLSTILGGALRR